MVSDLDIWRSANELVKQHSEDAKRHAAMRMNRPAEQGDLEGETFQSQKEVQSFTAALRRHQNVVRPHSAFGWRPTGQEVSLSISAACPTGAAPDRLAETALIHYSSILSRDPGSAIGSGKDAPATRIYG